MQVAPFLRLDSDPYPVLSEGKLYWIQDAYTTSHYLPYANPQWTTQYATASQPASGSGRTAGQFPELRRGGGRIHGDIRGVELHPKLREGRRGHVRRNRSLFRHGSQGTRLAAYRRAFPGVFEDLSQISEDLKAHLRYPEDLFTVQADQYRTFHMTDPQVFYNREDLWAAPLETYAGETQAMKPY